MLQGRGSAQALGALASAGERQASEMDPLPALATCKFTQKNRWRCIQLPVLPALCWERGEEALTW